MPQELDIPKDKSTVFLEGTLGNPGTLQILLSQSEAKEEVLD